MILGGWFPRGVCGGASVGLCWVLAACGSSATTAAAVVDSLAARTEAELSSLRRDTAVVFGYSAEGASLEAHSQGDALMRLQVVYYGETGFASETYYYAPDLVLALVERAEYDAPLSGQVSSTSVSRFYVRDGTVWSTVGEVPEPGRPFDPVSESQRLRAVLDSAVRARP